MTTFSVIDIDTWGSGERLILASGWIVFMLLHISLTTYIYKTHLSKMIDAFDNSPAIKLMNQSLLNRGPIARSLLISFISGAITYAPVLAAQGHISIDDVEKIPRHLKRLLSIDGILSSATILWVTTVCILVSIRGFSS